MSHVFFCGLVLSSIQVGWIIDGSSWLTSKSDNIFFDIFAIIKSNKLYVIITTIYWYSKNGNNFFLIKLFNLNNQFFFVKELLRNVTVIITIYVNWFLMIFYFLFTDTPKWVTQDEKFYWFLVSFIFKQY